MATIQLVDRNANIDVVKEILERDGAVIYNKLLDEEVMDTVRTELDIYMARGSNGEGEVWDSKPNALGRL